MDPQRGVSSLIPDDDEQNVATATKSFDEYVQERMVILTKHSVFLLNL